MGCPRLSAGKLELTHRPSPDPAFLKQVQERGGGCVSGRHPGIPPPASAADTHASEAIAFQMGHLWGNQAVAEHSGTSPWKEKRG